MAQDGQLPEDAMRGRGGEAQGCLQLHPD